MIAGAFDEIEVVLPTPRDARCVPVLARPNA
jgi:hypothetical protein